VSSFGCLSSTIPLLLADLPPDGRRTASSSVRSPSSTRATAPRNSLWAQSAWAIVLTLSGTYEQLYTYVTFAAVLSTSRPGPRSSSCAAPGRTCRAPTGAWGYPVVPALFILASLVLLANTLVEKPREALWGLLFVALGLPAYAWWRLHGVAVPEADRA